MPTIPNWLTGPGGSYAVTVTPYTNTNGTLATTTPVQTITTTVDTIRVAAHTRLEEISAMTSTRENNVPIQVGTQITLTEILKASGTNGLAQFANAFSYGLVAITRGAQAWSFAGVQESYDEDLQRGKSTGTLVMNMIDPGTANPTYT